MGTFKAQIVHMFVHTPRSGVMNPPIEQLTADGYDLQFGTNVVGHYVFTKCLLPLLFAGAQSSPDKKARIVNISSSAQMFVNRIDLDAMKDVPKRKELGSATMYMQSKFVTVLVILTGRYCSLMWFLGDYHPLERAGPSVWRTGDCIHQSQSRQSQN
jgi:NAD(P)-dependent dehydrogenase (short-subunit alcohol dehydrogenase family)